MKSSPSSTLVVTTAYPDKSLLLCVRACCSSFPPLLLLSLPQRSPPFSALCHWPTLPGHFLAAYMILQPISLIVWLKRSPTALLVSLLHHCSLLPPCDISIFLSFSQNDWLKFCKNYQPTVVFISFHEANKLESQGSVVNFLEVIWLYTFTSQWLSHPRDFPGNLV